MPHFVDHGLMVCLGPVSASEGNGQEQDKQAGQISLPGQKMDSRVK
jgi:hypothetical protein